MASPRSLLEDLPFHLARTALSFRRFDDQTLRAVGLEHLAPGYASVLHALDQLGSCTVSRLVQVTHLANGTLTGLLDGLEREGCIKRVRNPKDGRSWLVQLTPRGRRVCTKLHARHSMVMDFLHGAFSEDEAAELGRLLAKATDRMRAYGRDHTQTEKPAR